MRRWLLSLTGLLIGIIALAGCDKEQAEKPSDVFQAYLQDWQGQNYAAMYSKLTPTVKSSLTEEDFARRYSKIYEGIAVRNLKVTGEVPQNENELGKDVMEISYSFKVELETDAGPVAFTHEAKLLKTIIEKEPKWLVAWDPSLIFPQMQDGDKVRVLKSKGERGQIYDRSGNGLAVNTELPQIGIIPGKLGADSNKTKAKLAQWLNCSVADIDKKLHASWVKADLFVPIAVVPEESLDQYLDLPGVDVQRKKGRAYPYGEAAAHLTGYIAEISAEQLEKNKDKGYHTGDLIGKSGLELVYEQKLKGQDGMRIIIVDNQGKEKEVLAEIEATAGETVILTIDAVLQQTIYDELKTDTGSAAAIDPLAGDVLALVSSPSYDPNVFQRGILGNQYRHWSEDPQKPFLNRFAQGYAPGSAFKLITAAIGLDTGKLDPAEKKSISGLKWTADRSWGNYYVKRVHDVSPVNLQDALVYSDNIYFAQTALAVGREAFAKEAAKYGVGEAIPIPYPMKKSQIANNGINSDVLLADTGYGQGELTMTSLQVALMFSAVVNDGSIIYPLLSEQDRTDPVKYWKEQAMSPETAGILKTDLIKTVSTPGGASHGAYIPGVSIAGKTGTAELKQSKGGEGSENGWFAGFNADDPQLLLAVMIENVKGRGGSGYTTAKVKNIFLQALNKVEEE
ncbi:penicillin-binding transpeptidase domain-containing protein [Paenibacillus nasutitermitis]|uniref:Penicillin-binding protein 3 n=1 Tax=Paenibacillus nasutitermitis TaxID=1652958 RepID=A0A916YXL2_9BACL|nr:penicillin-binding transpeptidase domain-containing protein [Paenibacillus nasutitermitis]GGD66725.1 penicillin-binding protein 3 [Paenibacillus nasutitermitis]